MWQARIERFGTLFEAAVLGFGVLWALWVLALG
jgi:hypothetical protein